MSNWDIHVYESDQMFTSFETVSMYLYVSM